MKLSIILPALNEASGIAATLTALQPLRAAGHELIVVDGGSSDATALLASVDADQVITSRRGRALQMNAGAAAARPCVTVSACRHTSATAGRQPDPESVAG